MPYPSTLTSFSNPLPTDRLNSPSHSSIETAQNTGLTELQTYIGVITGANASVVGTLLYDIKSPASDGGGHVQTANKGGTGQTAFTKGDILVATNSSTLAKLSAGTDNQILQVNSSTASGLNWVNTNTNKIAVSASVITIPEQGVASVYSITLAGSTLGTSNVVRATIPIPQWRFAGNTSVMAVATYGGVVGSVMLSSYGASVMGKFTHTMIANNSANLQTHYIGVEGVLTTGGQEALFNDMRLGPIPGQNSVLTFGTNVNATSSVNSSANQTMGMEIRLVGSNSQMNTGGYIVEKIV